MKNKEQRAKYLVKNTMIFAVGNIATKFITFFLVPFYTNVLSTTEYGTIDLINTICTVLAPVIILNISESVMRFSLDKNADYSKILSVGILIFILAVIAGLLIFPINSLFTITSNYSLYIYFYTITYAGSQLFLCYLRGKEKLVLYTIGGVIQTLLVACLNIVLVVIMKLGIDGFFLSYIISYFLTMVYGGITGNIHDVIINFSINKKLFFQMIKYSVVLIPNTFMWWIMNTSDRIMVTTFVSVSANGIYAISYKLPTLVSTVTSVFNQAWSYSAIREEGSEDEEEYNNKILKMFICVVMLIGISILSFTKPFLNIYVAEDYYSAWKYTPFLTIGCVYLTLGTFMATTYTVHKDSFGYLFSGLFGALFNIVLNLWLIPLIGVYGAAIATCVSYIAVFVFRLFHTRKYIKYNIINKEFIIGSILMLISACMMFIDNLTGLIIQAVIYIMGLCLYAYIWFPVLKTIIRHKT